MSTVTATSYVQSFRTNNKGKGLKDLLREVSAAWKAEHAEVKAARPTSVYRSFLQTKLGELSGSHPDIHQTERMKMAQEAWKEHKKTLPPKEPAPPKDVTKMPPYQRFIAENMDKIRTESGCSAKEAMAKLAAMWREQNPAKEKTSKKTAPKEEVAPVVPKNSVEEAPKVEKKGKGRTKKADA